MMDNNEIERPELNWVYCYYNESAIFLIDGEMQQVVLEIRKLDDLLVRFITAKSLILSECLIGSHWVEMMRVSYDGQENTHADELFKIKSFYRSMITGKNLADSCKDEYDEIMTD
jgi:hypothetical protein